MMIEIYHKIVCFEKIIGCIVPVSDGDYVYDAFVSYCGSPETDRWVVRELLSHVESQMGFHVCVHHRDFIPGDSESYHHFSGSKLCKIHDSYFKVQYY